MKNLINSKMIGTTVKHLNKYIIERLIIKLPDLQTQQSIIDIIEPKENLFIKYHKVIDISDWESFNKTWNNLIDIIEPFEKLQSKYEATLTQLNTISKLLINESKVIGTMKDNDVTFEKGKNIPSKLLTSNPTNTLFINISSINNKSNKWVNDSNIISNCNYGDVLISLDGTIGLVNNFIKGFNGYAYKVISNKYKNYQLYYSLIHNLNKTIINENAIGSVIQHASKSRDYLLLFNFKYDYLLEMIYEYEIVIKLILDKLNKIIPMLVDIYLI